MSVTSISNTTLCSREYVMKWHWEDEQLSGEYFSQMKLVKEDMRRKLEKKGKPKGYFL